MSFNIEVRGLNEALKKLEKLPDEVVEAVDADIEQACMDMQVMAQREVRVDKGFLKNSIRFKQEGKLNWVFGAYMKYAAYINWGTITRVKTESNWSDYAILFKGKGIRKTGGIYPTFFFSGSVDIGIRMLMKQLKTTLGK